jgi:hypothetical protein
MVLLYLIFLMSFLTPQTRTSCVFGAGRRAAMGWDMARPWQTSYDGAWRGVAGRAAAVRDLAATMVHMAAVVHVTWRRRCMRPAVEGEEYKVGWWGPLVTCEAPRS